MRCQLICTPPRPALNLENGFSGIICTFVSKELPAAALTLRSGDRSQPADTPGATGPSGHQGATDERPNRSDVLFQWEKK